MKKNGPTSKQFESSRKIKYVCEKTIYAQLLKSKPTLRIVCIHNKSCPKSYEEKNLDPPTLVCGPKIFAFNVFIFTPW